MDITIEDLRSIINDAVKVNLENLISADAMTSLKGDNMYQHVYSYRDEDGNMQKIRMSASNQKECDEKFQKFCMGEIGNNTMTYRDFVENVFYKSFMPQKESTQTTYKYFNKAYVFPYIGDKRLSDITVEDIQRIMNILSNGKDHGFKKNIVSGTIDRVVGMISHIFRIAIDMKKAKDNPVKRTLLKNYGKESENHTALPDDDISKIKTDIPFLSSKHAQVCIGLIAYTGMRPEEIRGLRWEDADLDGQYFTVNRAVTFCGSNRHTVVDTPKSKKSKRTVYIPTPLLEILLSVEDKTPDHYLVHAIRDPFKPICESSWKRLIAGSFKQLGITGKCSPYDFRSTFGTQYKEAGLTSAQVADLMGHADTRMVETKYAKTRHHSVMIHSDLMEQMNNQYSRANNLQGKNSPEAL